MRYTRVSVYLLPRPEVSGVEVVAQGSSCTFALLHRPAALVALPFRGQAHAAVFLPVLGGVELRAVHVHLPSHKSKMRQEQIKTSKSAPSPSASSPSSSVPLAACCFHRPLQYLPLPLQPRLPTPSIQRQRARPPSPSPTRPLLLVLPSPKV